MSEVHGKNIAASLPRTFLGSWNFAMPLEHVGRTITVLGGFSNKTKGMVTPPLLTLLFEPVDN